MSTELTHDAVRLHLARLLRMPGDRVVGHASLTDLAADSFMLVEVALALQDDYDIYFKQSDMETLRTVDDAVNLVLSRVAAKAGAV